MTTPSRCIALLGAAPLALALIAAGAPAQTPPNDDCANAIQAFDGVNPGDTTGATDSPEFSACSVHQDVWFYYVATCSSTVTADLCSNTSFDSKLEAFSGSCGNLTSLACNDDFCGLQSQVTFPVSQGATYLLRVGTYSAFTIPGPFELNIACGTVAESNPFGTGCPGRNGFTSFYEEFQLGTLDLSNTEFLCTPNAQGGWDVQATSGKFDPNFAATGTDLLLGDDAVAYNQALGFPFALPGSAASPTNAIDVSSNGFIWLVTDPLHFSQFSSSPSGLLSDDERLAPYWKDLDPSSNGAVYFEAIGSRAMVTWDQVPEWGQSVYSTFQVQFFSNGNLVLAFQTMNQGSSSTAVVGYSPGHGAADPGPTDLTAAVPFSTTGNEGRLILTSDLPLLGSAVVFSVANIPVTATGGGFAFGDAQLSIPLDAIGMPGCTFYTNASGGLFPLDIATGQSVALPVPNDPAFEGLELYFQAFVDDATINPFGLNASNGLQLILGSR